MTRNLAVLGVKVVILTFVLFLCYSVASLVTGLTESESTGQMGALMLLVVSALDTSVLSFSIIRSWWSGWRLVLATFLVFFGVATFLSQVETVVFLQHFKDIVPKEEIPRLFLQGMIAAALFSPLAVAVHGKTKRKEERTTARLEMPWKEWVWKLAGIAVIYIVVYIAFGALVAVPLGGKAFQEYYSGLQLPNWIIPFQFVRGLIWAGLAVLVVKMMKGHWWEAALAVALLFSVLMGALLLLPNPFMPPAVRSAHLVEVLSSNFVFGFIAVVILNVHQRISP